MYFLSIFCLIFTTVTCGFESGEACFLRNLVKEPIILTEQGPMNLRSDDFDWITGQTVKELQNIYTDKVFTQNGQRIFSYILSHKFTPISGRYPPWGKFLIPQIMWKGLPQNQPLRLQLLRFNFSSKWKAKQKQVQIFHIHSNRGQVWIPHLAKDRVLTVKH